MRSFTWAAILLMAATVQGQVTEGDCSRSRHRFNGQDAHIAREVIEAGTLRSLKVATANAPVSVIGGNPSGYTITICKAAALAEDLNAIRVAIEGGELKTTGPSGGNWSVSYTIRTPYAADLHLETKNGPVSVRNYEGSLIATATNGPLSFDNVNGAVEATTTNGPVKVSGASGTMKLQAQNGPVTIKLGGTHWVGGGLDASTNNGPLTLDLPRNYGSRVIAEAEGRGPISCRAPGCERYADMLGLDRRRGDEPRRIELGSGPSAVRVSTVNGPVTIRERD